MLNKAVQLESNWKGLESLTYLTVPPSVSAKLKQKFSDFTVTEDLGFELTGSGEHLYLQVKKTNLSTIEVAKKLASSTQQKVAAVGYAGMKDRRGECTQWFSVPLESNNTSLLSNFEKDNLQIVSTQRNSRKLKIGSHKLNHFEITLRECSGNKEEFETNLARITEFGIPNYFGQQRFGRELSNLHQLSEVIQEATDSHSSKSKKRFKRSMVISAARAYLFNQLLSERISKNNWNKYLSGDVLNLNGTDRNFVVDQAGWTDSLAERLRTFDIHITGPLPGAIDPKDRYISSAEAADMEDAVLEEFSVIIESLGNLGAKASRRPLRFTAEKIDWSWLDDRTLKLEFALRRGAYATSLLREICITE
ncbi:MAG: tRNA pseudouridine(13) synthase TruD [Pseudomonadales bacterium]|nr:tRNA pseudouridine(13) synthase TruD [Pseudomonadales bacterium]